MGSSSGISPRLVREAEGFISTRLEDFSLLHSEPLSPAFLS